MRYNTLKEEKYGIGAKRQRWGFLWLPKKIGTEWRWLEHAGREQVRLTYYSDSVDDYVHYWEATRWLPDTPSKGPSL